jgi:ribosomal protein L37AE/L43A
MEESDRLYCPVCGALMEKKAEEWYCPTGQAFLSGLVQKMILEAITETVDAKPDDLPDVIDNWTTPNYCPRCGEILLVTTEFGTRICKTCGLTLKPAAFHMLREYGSHTPL